MVQPRDEQRPRFVRRRDPAGGADADEGLGLPQTTVAKWRLRFNARRLAGLHDEPRPVSDDAVEAVMVKTLETTPKGETHWSTRTMALAAGMSHTMVGRWSQASLMSPMTVRKWRSSRRRPMCPLHCL